MTKKLLGLAIAGIALIAGSASAISFSFTSFAPQDPIGDKFADTHFFTPGNDYAGSFFWLPTVQTLPSVPVTLGSDIRYCTKKVRGLYFGNAWGARLWPLDQQTLNGLISIDPSYNDLTINGALYTSCTNTSNTNSLELYSVYGQVTYTWKGKTFSISMGRMYDMQNNAMIPGEPLVSSVQYFNNQTPLGYFYDNIAGIGFIGGILPEIAHDAIIDEINNGGYIDEIFTFEPGSTSSLVAQTTAGDFSLTGPVNAGLDTLWRIAILGNVLLSKGGLSIDDRRSILGNPNQGSSIVVSDKMNISNSINQLKRNASALCRGKRVYDDTNWYNAPLAGVVCIGAPSDDFNEADPVIIDLSDTASYQNRTIIVYGKNVELIGSMPQSLNYALNLFVDKGNVLMRDPIANVLFDPNGNIGGGISAMYLRGNIFINGLLFGADGNLVDHKIYIHGRFASLNTGLEPAQARKNQIQTLFDNQYTNYGTTITTNYCGGTNCINFINTFAWECQLNGMGTDGNLCNVPTDRFKYNPFIIVDTIIPTTLL